MNLDYYESFTFLNKLQKNSELFHDILIFLDAPVLQRICDSCDIHTTVQTFEVSFLGFETKLL